MHKSKVALSFFLLIYTVAFAQILTAQAVEAPVCVIVKSRDIEPFEKARHGFEAAFREQRPDAKFLVRSLEGKKDQEVLGLFNEILGQHPTLVLAIGSSAALAAREHIRTAPVLFTMVIDPERSGLAPPGVEIKVPKVETLRVLHRLLPSATRIGVIYSSESESHWKELREQASSEGFQAVGSKIDNGEKLPTLFEDIASQIDVFLMLADAKLFAPKTVERLLLASIKHRVPVVGLSSSYTKAGALISLEYNHEDSGRTAVAMALSILQGVAPDTLGYVHPSRIQYSLNAEVAQQMKIRIPEDVLKNASEVFG